MPAKPVVDRKTRGVIALIVIMLIATVALSVRGYVSKVGESQIHTSPMAADERLVIIDGRSMLIQPEAVGPTMSHWLNSAEDKKLTFELSDRSFVPNSPAPSPITEQRIQQVAQLSRSSPSLMVHIVLPVHFPSTAAQQLDQKRAAGLRSELMRQGVSTSHVAVEGEAASSVVANGAEMAVVLTK